jgi:hypothetical protein
MRRRPNYLPPDGWKCSKIMFMILRFIPLPSALDFVIESFPRKRYYERKSRERDPSEAALTHVEVAGSGSSNPGRDPGMLDDRREGN